MAALTSDRRTGRRDGSMSLLADITNESLDAAYADHAARASSPDAREREVARRTPARRAVSVGLLVLLGVMTGTAIDQVRERAAASVGVRVELVEEVEATTAESDALVGEVAALRADVARTREAALGADLRGQTASDRVAALALSAGAVPVTGPGIVVTLDDAAPTLEGPELSPRGGRPEESRLTDRQLQAAVNGIWAVGAEAVSVNGIRLTALTAIRSAGEAILVDFRPLSPPYVVQAVGDPKQLEFDLLDSPVGRGFALLAEEERFGFDVQRAEELVLASAGEPDLVYAEPVVTEEPVGAEEATP